MSLKCSIFGHRFGEPAVERDRDESGSEVVITIREIQTCDRCGEERVVSENKEVTTLETADDEAADGPATEVPDAADELAAVDSGGSDGDAAETVDASDREAAGGTGDPPADAESLDPETDDATIIEDSPDESIVEEAEPDGPTAEAPDLGAVEDADEEPEDDDAVILDDDADEDDGEDREPGAWPDEPEDEAPEWEPPEIDADSSETTESPVEEATPDVEPVGEAVTVPQGAFHCPECGFTTEVESSSLRAGDFCPDCHTGTLTHDQEAE